MKMSKINSETMKDGITHMKQRKKKQTTTEKDVHCRREVEKKVNINAFCRQLW